MRADPAPIGCLIRIDTVFNKGAVKNPVKVRIMEMMDVWKKMVCNVIIKASKNEIGKATERVHVVGTFNLVHDPG